MPPVKEAQPRSCSECGRMLERKRYNGRLEDFGVFQRRKFCDLGCMARNFDARPSAASSPVAKTGNYHARKIIPPAPCSLCGAPAARDIHHLNGDRNDNRMLNLARVCRSCHVRVHH